MRSETKQPAGGAPPVGAYGPTACMGASAEPMPCGQHIGCLVRGCKNSNKYVLKQIFLLRPEWFQKIFFIFAVETIHFLHVVGHQNVGLAG